MVPKHPSYSEQVAYIDLLQQIDKSALDYNEEQIVDTFFHGATSLYTIQGFANFEKIFPGTFRDRIQNDEYGEKLDQMVKTEIRSTQDSDIDTIKDQVLEIQSKFNRSFENEIEELNERQTKYEALLKEQDDNELEEVEEQPDLEGDEEIKTIDELFTSLIDNK
jgi:hypothetical protein